MTVHHDFHTADSSALNAMVRAPEIDPKRIRHLALSGGTDAASNYAAATADRVNAGARSRLELQLSEGQADVAKIEQQIEDYTKQAESRSSVLWRRKQASESWAQMTRMEVIHAGFYVVLTLIALGVATYALALMLSELEVVEKLSKSIWQAVLYAFPVVLASSGFASMATLHDDEKVIEQRTMRLLRWGALFFFGWMAMTAIVFVGEGGGYNPQDPLDLSNDPFAATSPLASVALIESAYEVLAAVFPAGTTSSMLLFVHIVAEVLIAAGLIARVVLMGRKTREIEAYHCPRGEKARARVAELERQKQFRAVVIANIKGQLAEIEAIKQQFIEDVSLHAASEARTAQALRDAAQAKSDIDYLESAL
ncbi:MAG: hypothetical protein V2I76_06780 [Roseobacter sp.]|jgi:hypothetical protein|nr:hypothetical protein [Roseobacter sp.]